MPYDEELAFRLRAALEQVEGITDKRMFGGIAFLLHGNMTVAASSKGNLMVRIDPADTEAALAKPHVSRMEMGKKRMNGWIRVDDPGYDSDADLQAWIDQSLAFAETLPPK